MKPERCCWTNAREEGRTSRQRISWCRGCSLAPTRRSLRPSPLFITYTTSFLFLSGSGCEQNTAFSYAIDNSMFSSANNQAPFCSRLKTHSTLETTFPGCFAVSAVLLHVGNDTLGRKRRLRRACTRVQTRELAGEPLFRIFTL